MKIQEMGPDDRPREKMLSKGAAALSNAELIAILLRSGTGGMNAVEMSRELLKAAGGSLTDLASMPVEKMTETGGIGTMKAVSLGAAFELGRRFLIEKSGIRKVSVTTPRMVYESMAPLLKGLDREEFWILWLNRANYIIGKDRMSVGGMNETVVDPRLTVKAALEKKASGVIMVHNHPSGNPRPGKADIEVTNTLKKALNVFNISLVDHIIICDDRFYSFTDERVEIME